MTTTWISPWSGNPVTVEELICEVALVTASRMYVFATLGLPEPHVSIESDSIIVRSARIDYSYEVFYPHDLNEDMHNCFSDCLLSMKREYGLYIGDSPRPPSGEHLGEMLRRFESLERLLRLVSARHCWDESNVLALHGLLPKQFLSSLKNELDHAGIHYLIVLPLNDEVGSGVFKAIPTNKAIDLINDLRAERRGSAEAVFGLETDFGPHTWASNNDRWTM